MTDYEIFGGTLRSAVVFPELAPATSRSPRWVLRLRDVAAPLPDLRSVGTEDVSAGVTVTLMRANGISRLVFDDTGSFDISADGCQIDWTPPASPDMESVRKDLLGRVFAVALDQQGILALHGSAVALGDVALAFVAPKFHGKSTTATALVNSGGALLADDLVPVAMGEVPKVLPSVPMVQLWKDSAENVGGGASPLSAPDLTSPKLQVAWKGADRNATAAVPLAAVYLLAPVKGDARTHVRRVKLSGVEAALVLLGQTKVGALLGVERRMQLLDRLTDLACRTPVFRLEIPRDFGRIEELTSSLWGWHSATDSVEESA